MPVQNNIPTKCIDYTKWLIILWVFSWGVPLFSVHLPKLLPHCSPESALLGRYTEPAKESDWGSIAKVEGIVGPVSTCQLMVSPSETSAVDGASCLTHFRFTLWHDAPPTSISWTFLLDSWINFWTYLPQQTFSPNYWHRHWESGHEHQVEQNNSQSISMIL